MITARDTIKKAQFFDLGENWGNIDMVHYRLIEVMDTYRKFLGSRIHISPVEGAVHDESKGHTDKSWHYIIPGRNKFSRAADIFPDCELYEAFIMALRFNFTGVGVYPYAEYQDKGIIKEDTMRGMLHLDLRTAPNFRVIWWKDLKGKYHYVNNVNDFDKLVSIIKPE
jgi:hypothetical protein